MRIFCSLSALILLQSCFFTQDPAVILLKGENYYGKEANAKLQDADSKAQRKKNHKIKVKDLSQ